MKKIKFILPVIVFVFAFAISFASVKHYDVQVTEYMQKTTNPVQCIQITPVCARFGGFTCTVVSASNPSKWPLVVYDNQLNATMCAYVLQHNTPVPIQIP